MTSVQTSLTPSLDKLAISRHLDRHICDREYLTIQCLKCGHRHQIRGGSRDRTCPACAKEIYQRIYRKYEKFISTYSDLKFLTLTWKPVKEQSPELVRAIGRAVAKLRHRKKYAKRWKAILATVECKKTKTGMFYYHIHCIVSGSYVPQAEISRDWKEISGFPIVHIKRIWRTPTRALRYVLKYVLKGFSFESEKDRHKFKESMKGVRYLRSYGDFYNFEYLKARHVSFPCPECGAVRAWILVDFCHVIDLKEGLSYA